MANGTRPPTAVKTKSLNKRKTTGSLPGRTLSITIHDVSDKTMAGIALAQHSVGIGSREEYLRSFLIRQFKQQESTQMKVAQRVRQVVDAMNSDAYEPVSFADIARALGHSDTARLEAIIRGDIELSFPDGHELCRLYEIDRIWLATGTGETPVHTLERKNALRVARWADGVVDVDPKAAG